jgi:hypothetical protein
MTVEEIKQELQNKIHELEWKNNLRSFEMITWLNELLKKMETKEAPVKKEIKVEIPEVVEETVEEVVEEKKAPKRKIIFKKK